MARKLNPQEDRAQPLFAPEFELDDDPLFQDIADKRDKELLLSSELLAFFSREFPLPFFRR